MHITIVDDTYENLLSYREILEEEFAIELIQNPFELLEFLGHQTTDLILLDLHMPHLNGFELYKRLQSQHPDTPVIFLSGDPSEESVVKGLSLGAHDFIVKPVSSKELIARIKNRIKLMPTLNDKSSVVRISHLVIYCRDKIVQYKGETISLTPNEYKILKFLCKNKDTVFSKEDIQARVWPYNKGAAQNVETHISNLRKKLNDFRFHIKTIKAVGYIVKSKI